MSGSGLVLTPNGFSRPGHAVDYCVRANIVLQLCLHRSGATDLGADPYAHLAQMYACSTRSVRRYENTYLDALYVFDGDIDLALLALQPMARSGNARICNDNDDAFIRLMVQTNPLLDIIEYCEVMLQCTGVFLDPSTMCRAMQRLVRALSLSCSCSFFLLFSLSLFEYVYSRALDQIH